MNVREILEKAVGFFDLQDLFVFGGLAAITVGAGQVYPPLAWIVPGAACMALGIKMGGR